MTSIGVPSGGIPSTILDDYMINVCVCVFGVCISACVYVCLCVYLCFLMYVHVYLYVCLCVLHMSKLLTWKHCLVTITCLKCKIKIFQCI